MKEKFKAKALTKQMKRYDKILKKTLTPELWTERQRIEASADHFLRALADDRFEVNGENVKVLADYIHTFTNARRDELYAKIQPYAGFNVKEYADAPKQNMWQKMFSRQPQGPQYLTAAQLKKRYQEYRKVCKIVERAGWDNKASKKQSKLRNEAMAYVDSVLNDKFIIKPEDNAEFKNYVSVVCYPVYDGSAAQQVLLKVKQQMSATRAAQPQVAPQTQSQSQAAKPSFWKRFGTKIKVAALSTLAVAGSLFGVKSCESATKTAPSQPQTEVVVAPQKPDTVKTVAVQPAAQKAAPVETAVAKAAPVKAQPVKSQASSAQKVWNNYYDNAVEILSSSAQKAKLYAQIDRQIANKVFALPNGVSKEKLAYCYTIYKEYGVKSSLKKALTATEKLSQADVLQMAKDINAAGKKGEGVKKMAAQLNNGKLSSYSKYDRASSHLQQQHAKTLKDIMQAKKAANVH